MNKMILLLAIMTIAVVVQGQAEETPEQRSEVFRISEEPPMFPGGVEELYIYMGKNTKYPKKAGKEGIEGVVFLEFIVNTDGTLSDIRVLRSPHELLSEEAIRVVEGMPAWEPGRQRGEPIRAFYNLPFRFTLEGDRKQNDKEK